MPDRCRLGNFCGPTTAAATRMVLEMTPVVPRSGQGQDRTRNGFEGCADVELVAADDLEAGQYEARDHRADDRHEERADDAAPELVRQEDREVPERDAHHDPDEEAH